MNIVFIVVAVWIALDVAIIAWLTHVSGGRPAGRRRGRIRAGAPAPSVVGAPAAMRLRLVVDPSTSASDVRLRAVSHR